jgi:hypothetical protein
MAVLAGKKIERKPHSKWRGFLSIRMGIISVSLCPHKDSNSGFKPNLAKREIYVR